MQLTPSRPPGSGFEGHQIRAFGLGFYVGGMFLLPFGLLGWKLQLTGITFVLFVFAGSALAGAFSAVIAIKVSNRAGQAAASVYNPTGSTTPYQRVFSYQKALEMRGDMAGARESYEALIAESPGDAAVRFAAAEFCAGRGKDPARAAELYREIRLLRGATAQHESAATNALIDLYRGPLADDGRARSELRRYAERFAGSPQGEMARRALEEMKRTPPGAAT